MKNFIEGVCALALALAIFCGCSSLADKYTCIMTVTALEAEGTVVCVDSTGEKWAFFGEGYKVGQTVKVTLDSNGTDQTRADDMIVKVKTIK